MSLVEKIDDFLTEVKFKDGEFEELQNKYSFVIVKRDGKHQLVKAKDAKKTDKSFEWYYDKEAAEKTLAKLNPEPKFKVRNFKH